MIKKLLLWCDIAQHFTRKRGKDDATACDMFAVVVEDNEIKTIAAYNRELLFVGGYPVKQNTCYYMIEPRELTGILEALDHMGVKNARFTVESNGLYSAGLVVKYTMRVGGRTTICETQCQIEITEHCESFSSITDEFLNMEPVRFQREQPKNRNIAVVNFIRIRFNKLPEFKQHYDTKLTQQPLKALRKAKVFHYQGFSIYDLPHMEK